MECFQDLGDRSHSYCSVRLQLPNGRSCLLLITGKLKLAAQVRDDSFHFLVTHHAHPCIFDDCALCDADNCAAWASNFLCSSNEVRSGWADGSGLGWGVLTRRRDREGEGEGAGALLGCGARGVQLPAQPAFCAAMPASS